MYGGSTVEEILTGCPPLPGAALGMCQRNPQVCGPGRCIPRPSGYTCACDPGFRLSPQGTHCLGEPDGGGGGGEGVFLAPCDQAPLCPQTWMNVAVCPRHVPPGAVRTHRAASTACVAPVSELVPGVLSAWVRDGDGPPRPGICLPRPHPPLQPSVPRCPLGWQVPQKAGTPPLPLSRLPTLAPPC